MIRVGHGYDVHRLVKDRRLVLGGVEIPYELGLLGHSDADVLLHAVCDALLGAAGLGDIGRHFPDTEEEFHNVDSRILLRNTVDLIGKHGYRLVNVDVTVIAQRPKLADYIEWMLCHLAEDLQVELSAVNVKATTEEGLGFTGSGEGIAAHAVCLLQSAE